MASISNTITITIDDLDQVQAAWLRQQVSQLLAELHPAPRDPDAVLGWTPSSAAELIRRLGVANRPVQARVIEAAAEGGGTCDRAMVYKLGGYDEDRSLKGFTRPVKRLMKQMQAEGLLPTDAVDPMEPVYDESNPSFQQAQGFKMPPELAPVFNPASFRRADVSP